MAEEHLHALLGLESFERRREGWVKLGKQKVRVRMMKDWLWR
jgi:hypothetical protein